MSDALREALEVALPIVSQYAYQHPKWTPTNYPEQDPLGSHAALALIEATLAAPRVEEREALAKAHEPVPSEPDAGGEDARAREMANLVWAQCYAAFASGGDKYDTECKLTKIISEGLAAPPCPVQHGE